MIDSARRFELEVRLVVLQKQRDDYFETALVRGRAEGAVIDKECFENRESLSELIAHFEKLRGYMEGEG